ncbi:MAG: autotransporter outer membrane beta-barrel domain-containing protein [Verrucomicrobiota bacterium]
MGRLKGVHHGLSGHLNALALGSLYEPESRGINAWTTAYGTWQRLNADSTVDSPGFSGNHFGNITGVENRLGALTLGISGAVGGSSANFGEGLGSLSADTWHAGVYGSVALGRVVVDAAASYGTGDNIFKRNSASVKFQDSEWLTQFGVSLPLKSGSLTITPSVHLLSSGYKQDTFTDSATGPLAMKVVGNSFTTHATKTGLQAAELLSIKGHAVRLSASSDWLHYLENKRQQTQVLLGGLDDAATTTEGSKAGYDALEIGIAAEIALTRRTTLRVSVQHEMQNNQTTTNGNVTLSVDF